MKKTAKQLKAITLLEVLVYLALFGMMFLVVVQFMITARESNVMAEKRTSLERTAIYLTNHLNSSFDKVNGFSDDSNTVYEDNNGSIRLLLTGKYLQYNLVDSALHFNDNGTDINITDPEFRVTRFYLQRLLNRNGNIIGVRVTLELISRNDSRFSKTITTSYILK